MGFVLFICHKCASRKNEQRHPTSHGSNSALYPFEPSLLLQWDRMDRTSYVRSCSSGSERKIAPFANYDIKLSFLSTLSTYPCKCKYIIEFQRISAVSMGTHAAPAHILTPAAAPTYPGWCGAPRRLGALRPRYAGRHKHRAVAYPKKAQREAKAEWRSATGEQGQ